MSKILLLASQHGDEYLGEKLFAYVRKYRPELLEHIEYLLANPRARKKQIRYIESDLNRSYNGKTETVEEKRAMRILNHIEQGNYDLVLDMHTTSCKQPPSIILASINPKNERFVRASSIEHVVIMEPQVVSTALNGVCPQSLSIEVNHKISDELLANLCDDLQRYVDNERYSDDKYVYKARLLARDELTDAEIKNLRNFELHERGFYPILVGEKSYHKQGYAYMGFKALKRRKIKV